MNGSKLTECRPGMLNSIAILVLASGLCCLSGAAQSQERRFQGDRGDLSIGAGSMAYIAQVSPATAFALDAHYAYPLMRRVDLEGTVLGAISQSADDNTATIPIITEAGVRLNTNRYGPVSLFGSAGLGYGAYLGSQELQDGATLTIPLGGGLEWRGRSMSVEPRFTYRPVFGDELGDGKTDADSWTAVVDLVLPFL